MIVLSQKQKLTLVHTAYVPCKSGHRIRFGLHPDNGSTG